MELIKLRERTYYIPAATNVVYIDIGTDFALSGYWLDNTTGRKYWKY